MITKERYIELVRAEKGGAELHGVDYEQMREFELSQLDKRMAEFYRNICAVVIAQRAYLRSLEKNESDWGMEIRKMVQEKVMPKESVKKVS